MLSSPQSTEPNHGSVMATVDGERWLVDASILSGSPIRIPGPGEPADEGRFPGSRGSMTAPPSCGGRRALRKGSTAGSSGSAPIQRSGIERHQRTAGWSPFNYQLSARLLEGETSVGVARGQRFRVEPDGSVSVDDLDPESRARFLVEVLGIAERIAVCVPDDRPLPPRPD